MKKFLILPIAAAALLVSCKSKTTTEPVSNKVVGVSPTFTGKKQLTESMIAYLYSRRAETVIVPMQDLLALPSSCRMNIPGTATGNWHWQMTTEQLKQAPVEFLKKLCEKYGR